jgi:hypothetical protein
MSKRIDMNRIGFVIYGTIILAASLALGACTFGTVNAQNEPNINATELNRNHYQNHAVIEERSM